MRHLERQAVKTIRTEGSYKPGKQRESSSDDGFHFALAGPRDPETPGPR
jgi:hypothetical protein